MGKLFYYKREVKRKVKDEEVIDIYWDCFNVDCVVRGLWRDKNTFLVLLNDGHEQAEDRQKPLFKNGKPAGYEIKRERDWFYSQVELDPVQAARFMEATDMEGKGFNKAAGMVLTQHLDRDVFEPEGQIETESLT